MSLRFALTHAARESRSSVRRLGIYMSAITLGVAALVAINSFRANIVRSVQGEARNLLGADVRLGSGRAFPDSVEALLDSLRADGRQVASITGLVSMAFSPRTETARLVQLRALAGNYPFYGTAVTEPAGEWPPTGDRTLVDEALLTQLGARVGDTLMIGTAAFRVAGTVRGVPGESGFQGVLGPRVFIDQARLADADLLGIGSMARYNAYIALPGEAEAQRFVDRYEPLFRRNQVGFDTAADQAANLARALDALGRFLGLVGLAALLLGGLGVASAVNVFIREKRATIAVLRCIGATQGTAFTAYLLQAALLGVAGAVTGALLGIVIQALLPLLLRDMLPVEVQTGVAWTAVGSGIAIGAGVAILFALLPLLEVRGIAPLRALRQPVEDTPIRFDPARIAAMAVLLAAVAGIAIWQAGDWRPGLAFAAALAAALLLLRTAAWLLTRLTRSAVPRSASFPVRQGIAGLFRPYNQTVAVTLSVGFGVFLIAALWLVQRNLLDWLEIESGARANLVVLDIQSDQVAAVDSVLAAAGVPAPEIVPIVPARIAAIGGVPVPQLLADPERRIEPWTLRREYRHTYRAELTDAETLVAGEWWTGAAEEPATAGARVGRISIEQDLAGNLGVGVGDRITWNFQGIEIETVVASIRTVDWARFETNFFVVFEPGILEAAPQTFVSLAFIEDPAARTAVQRDLVVLHANLTTVDLEEVQRTLSDILGRVVLALRFMAGFSIVAGALVLSGAIASARFQRVRESVLLRAIGATRGQIRTILLTEYLALGTLAAVTGIALASLASWALVSRFFNLEFSLHALDLVVMVLIVAAGTAALGMANSGEAVNGTPLAALREAD
jgi:putative ABC transport system permease protein